MFGVNRLVEWLVYSYPTNNLIASHLVFKICVYMDSRRTCSCRPTAFTCWQTADKHDAWSVTHSDLWQVSPISVHTLPAAWLVTRRPCSRTEDITLPPSKPVPIYRPWTDERLSLSWRLRMNAFVGQNVFATYVHVFWCILVPHIFCGLSYTVASCTWCFEPPQLGIPQLQPIWCFETPQSRRQLSVIQNTSMVFWKSRWRCFKSANLLIWNANHGCLNH
jgi:hypothetical protein